jgi:LDH2 family malate/lactate/ureidoglycolate dehydrogenase
MGLINREIRVGCDELETKCIDLLRASGVCDFCAEHTVRGLLFASMRGIDSHGIRLLPHYLKVLESGRINSTPSFHFEQSAAAVGLLDADHSFGIPAGVVAMEHCMEMVQNSGVAMVSVKNSSHCGALSYFTSLASQRGYIGFSATGATPKLATPNAKKSFFGTNPICVVLPTGGQDFICFDSAMSMFTGNKVKLYRSLGKSLPEGVCCDSDGVPTCDSSLAQKLVPIGDYKGWGLAMLVDVFTNMLAGMPTADEVSVMYGSDLSERRHLGHIVGVIDPSKFFSGDNFSDSINDVISRIRGEKRFDGISPIVLPGDPESVSAKRSATEGVSLPLAVFTEIESMLSLHNIKINPIN